MPGETSGPGPVGEIKQPDANSALAKSEIWQPLGNIDPHSGEVTPFASPEAVQLARKPGTPAEYAINDPSVTEIDRAVAEGLVRGGPDAELSRAIIGLGVPGEPDPDGSITFELDGQVIDQEVGRLSPHVHAVAQGAEVDADTTIGDIRTFLEGRIASGATTHTWNPSHDPEVVPHPQVQQEQPEPKADADSGFLV